MATPPSYPPLGQPYSAKLTALAALVWAANKLIRLTGSSTADLLDFDTDGTLAANSDTRVASQKAVKTYIDAKVEGLSWKAAVRVATTAAGTLASSFENGDTVDGVVLATGDRILIKNQASGAENGIYTVNESGAPTRALDANIGAELVNAAVFVSEGTANADTAWVCTNNTTITLGSTSLAFVQFGLVSDGDKGDITVTVNGTVWTIDAKAVTYAKIQDVTATSRVLGRKSSGAGVVEELTLSEILDFVGSAAQGDILYRDASAWARLGAGSSGKFLKTNGSGANPSWATPIGFGATGYIQSPDSIDDPNNDNFDGVSGNLDTSGTGNRFTGSNPWTWVQQATATATIVRQKRLRLQKGAATSGHSMITVPIPSGNWLYRAHVGFPIAMSTSTKAAGMVLRDSASSRIEFFGWGISPGGIIWSAKYTNHNTFSASRTTNAQTTQYLAPRFFEIEYDGTNYYLRYGNDEAGMIELINFAKTDFLTNVADQIGFSVLTDNAAGSSATIDVEEFFRVV